MDFDYVIDNKFHTSQANPIARQTPPSIGSYWAGNIHHNLCLCLWYVLKFEFRRLIIKNPLIDNTLFTFCTRHGDFLTIFKDLSTIPRTDNSRYPKFSTDNGRMTSPSAMISDNAGSLFHNWYPIRVCHASNKNGTFLKKIDLINTLNTTDLSSCNRFTDTDTG